MTYELPSAVFYFFKYSICCPLDSASRGKCTTCYTRCCWLSWFPSKLLLCRKRCPHI